MPQVGPRVAVRHLTYADSGALGYGAFAHAAGPGLMTEGTRRGGTEF